MALTVSTGTTRGRSGPDALGPRATAILQVTFDNSYPTGGEALDFKQYTGFTPAVMFFQERAGLGGYTFRYDYANKKIMVFWVDTTVDGKEMVEVVNTTDLSALVVDVLLIGD